MSTQYDENNRIDTLTIAASGTVSSSVEIGNWVPVGVGFPSAWTAGDYSIQVSLDGATWWTLPASAGTFTGAADQYQPVDPSLFLGVRYVRIVSTPTQVAERLLKVVSHAP